MILESNRQCGNGILCINLLSQSTNITIVISS